MRLSRTCEFKVMTIWIAQELSLFNFERLDILCAWIGHPSENLWSFELLKSFRCSISSISIYYAPESDLRVKSYDHLNFSRASVVKFQASQYIMRLNRTSVWKVMIIWISRELPLFNFGRLDILYASESELNLWTFEFFESFRCSILSVSIYYAPESDLRVKRYDHLNCSRALVVPLWASRYLMRLNRTSVWKVMTIWISRELPLLNFKRLNISCAWIGPPSEKLWPFEFLVSLHYSISSDSLYYAPESDLRFKSYDQLDFLRASTFNF